MCFEETSKASRTFYESMICVWKEILAWIGKKSRAEMTPRLLLQWDRWETAEALDYGWSWEWKGADWDILGRETVIWKQSGYTCGGLGVVREPQQSIIKPSPPGLEPHSLESSTVQGGHRTSAQPAVTAMNEPMFTFWRIIMSIYIYLPLTE